MSDVLTFAMGKYEARIPADRRYSENHLWLLPAPGYPGTGRYRVGLTAYSVRLLQDVYFLDWTIDPGTAVAKRQAIGEIESSKAVSALYAPAAGTVLGFNEALLNDPSAINVDGYGAGWLYEFATDDHGLDPAAYLSHLEAGWEKDQRYLQGQVNRG